MQAIEKRILYSAYLLFIMMALVSSSAMSATYKTAAQPLLALQVSNELTDTTKVESKINEDINEDEETDEALEEPIVPTRIQWLILTGVALLVGLVSYLFKAHQLTTEGELNIYPITKTFSIPLHKPIYKFMIFLTASMALIGFAICLSIYNSVFMPDIVGVSIAGPIFAYLIHLLYLMEKGRKGDD